MKLYESPSPNARRVHIFMAEKGLECDRIAVDIRAAENLSAEYLAKNPGGRVPMLELADGTCIGESVAVKRASPGQKSFFRVRSARTRRGVRPSSRRGRFRRLEKRARRV